MAARARADARRNQAEAADGLTDVTTDDLTGAWVCKFGLAEVARANLSAQFVRARS
jgi:hypothetical protein